MADVRLSPRGLTLYGRAYCHLCDEMREALAPLVAEFGVAVSYVDVDSDPALEACFGEWVPVLMAGERELCHYHLDSAAVRAYLTQTR